MASRERTGQPFAPACLAMRNNAIQDYAMNKPMAPRNARQPFAQPYKTGRNNRAHDFAQQESIRTKAAAVRESENSRPPPDGWPLRAGTHAALGWAVRSSMTSPTESSSWNSSFLR